MCSPAEKAAAATTSAFTADPDNYVYRLTLSSYAEAEGNRVYVFFNYTDPNNAYYLDIGGGASNSVMLHQLSTARLRHWQHTPIHTQLLHQRRCGSAMLAVAPSASRQRRAIQRQYCSTKVQDSDLMSGAIGVDTLYNQVVADDVISQPTIKAHPRNGACQPGSPPNPLPVLARGAVDWVVWVAEDQKVHLLITGETGGVLQE